MIKYYNIVIEEPQKTILNELLSNEKIGVKELYRILKKTSIKEHIGSEGRLEAILNRMSEKASSVVISGKVFKVCVNGEEIPEVSLSEVKGIKAVWTKIKARTSKRSYQCANGEYHVKEPVTGFSKRIKLPFYKRK